MHRGEQDQVRPWPPDEVVDGIRWDLRGRTGDLGLVLGSGLGPVAEALEDPWIRPASEIPGYPESNVAGHAGRLLLGRLGGRETWVVQGRVHLYEGHTAEVVTRQVRLLHALGVRTLILTNAAGSVDRSAAGPGDVLAAADAVSLFFRPLVSSAGAAGIRQPGAMDPGWRDLGASGAPDSGREGGPGWLAGGPVVDPVLYRLVQETARDEGIPLRLGVLVGSLGPCYETAAEVRAWRRIGGTVASMSTLPEAMEARRLGMRVLLFSLVTNHATGLSDERLTHDDVVRMATEAGGRLARLLAALAPRLP
jgi:purine-nucleoside phosphorylase